MPPQLVYLNTALKTGTILLDPVMYRLKNRYHQFLKTNAHSICWFSHDTQILIPSSAFNTTRQAPPQKKISAKKNVDIYHPTFQDDWHLWGICQEFLWYLLFTWHIEGRCQVTPSRLELWIDIMCVPSHVCNSSAAEPRVEMALTTSWNVNIWTQVKSPFPENLIMICAFNGVSDGLGVGSGSICESEGFKDVSA